jgi:hypothetical protein
MSALLVSVYLFPPTICFGVSYFAHSKIVRLSLRCAAVYFFGFFGLNWLLDADCKWNDFIFSQCYYVPQWLANTYSSMVIPNMIAYLVVAPFLLIVALFYEMKIRQYKQFD